MPNADELNATMAVIKANPHLWDQDDYFTETECGTAACFDGWTLLRHGYDLHRLGSQRIEYLASTILDLNPMEHHAVAYYFTRSIEDLELRVKEITAGEWADRDDGVVW
jgi:hypothetical protein